MTLTHLTLTTPRRPGAERQPAASPWFLCRNLSSLTADHLRASHPAPSGHHPARTAPSQQATGETTGWTGRAARRPPSRASTNRPTDCGTGEPAAAASSRPRWGTVSHHSAGANWDRATIQTGLLFGVSLDLCDCSK